MADYDSFGAEREKKRKDERADDKVDIKFYFLNFSSVAKSLFPKSAAKTREIMSIKPFIGIREAEKRPPRLSQGVLKYLFHQCASFREV